MDYYASEAGEQVAFSFIDAVENAFRAIARYPEAALRDTPTNLICPACAATHSHHTPIWSSMLCEITSTYGACFMLSAIFRLG